MGATLGKTGSFVKSEEALHEAAIKEPASTTLVIPPTWRDCGLFFELTTQRLGFPRLVVRPLTVACSSS